MKFFLSYSSQNREFVKKLRQALLDTGISPIETNLKSTIGSDIIDGLDKVLPNIDYVIVVFSKAYKADAWFSTELAAFIGKEMSVKYKLIMPIIIEDCQVPDLLAARIAGDFRGSFEDGYKELLDSIAAQRQVFVVIKFGDADLDSAFEGAIESVANDHRYSVMRIDKIQDSEIITVQILREIAKSEVVIADLTHDSPNCYYEVGYAQALGKKIILTRRRRDTDTSRIPFDLAGNRFILWKNEGELRKGLKSRFGAIRKEAKKGGES
jgi:hypothetical protein